MTDVRRSPYTGRPVDELLTEEIELFDSDDDKIGKVVEINPDFIVAHTNTGFLGLGEPKLYYIPRSYVAREEDDEWYLNVDKDQIQEADWRQPPAESAWSAEWDQPERFQQRGGTRLRRYEEELVADTHERPVGEVVAHKEVVEETKTIDVPVRREEVHVERRPVSGDAADRGDMADDAFKSETVRVPVMEEEVEVRKVPRVVEEVEISKSAERDTRHIEDTVRREEIHVDEDETKRTR